VAREDRARLLRWAAKTRRRHRLAGAVLRDAAPMLPRAPDPVAPVFVIGAPRSGTTLVFELFDLSPSLAPLGVESHLLWDAFHRLSDRGDHSVPAAAVTDRERRALSWAIRRIAGDRTYLDKYPRLCLRVPYLAALYPDARFVHVVRDGRAVTSSLITAWRTPGRFGLGTRLPVPLQIEGYEGDTWRFLVPPGWRDLAQGATLAEVCAFQWSAANQAVLAARDGMPGERWTEIRYEQLVSDPAVTMSAAMERLGISGDEVVEAAEGLGSSVTRTAVTAPRTDKWRDENPDEIASVLDRLEPVMTQLGYSTLA